MRIANGNTSCKLVTSCGGAGGFISGIITLSRKITAFATRGGKGVYEYKYRIIDDFDVNHMIKGGYGGGGATFNHYGADYNYGSGSGGGQTAVKFLSNDLWHRVIVSGAGGGSDNVYPTETLKGTDDGSGGAGGGFVGQGLSLIHI